MKKNTKDLLKMGILIPAMVLSLAACGASGTTEAKATEETAAEETVTEETAEAEAPAEETQEATEPAAEAVVYENGGYKLTVPAEMADKVTVTTPEKSEDDVLFDVSETASVEAAKKLGEDATGQGWLFAICKKDADTAHKVMMDSLGGEDVIATDVEDNYFIFYTPTDVRYVRETTEQMQADQDQWGAACEWASTVKQSFATENNITPVSWGGTEVEQWLARVAYGNVKYTLSTTEFGPLEPKDVDPMPYFRELTTLVKYEYADQEAPDGEYVVLNFPDDDYRFDFFLAEGGENFVRMTWNNEENTELYKVTFEDGTSKASAIMQEWYDAIATAQGLK